jgi:hypothetical protein
MGEMRNVYKILVRKPEGNNHSDDLGVDVRIILEWILAKQDEKLWTACIWFRVRIGGQVLYTC